MRNFLCFKTMLTPIIIQIFFWICLFFSVFSALYVMYSRHSFGIGIQILIFGPLVARIFCEMTMVIFRINDNLTDINRKLTHS